MQSCPDGEYKWILHYQDHLTKFTYLRCKRQRHLFVANIFMPRYVIFYFNSYELYRRTYALLLIFIRLPIYFTVRQWKGVCSKYNQGVKIVMA
jgi:hypothetical protein